MDNVNISISDNVDLSGPEIREYPDTNSGVVLTIIVVALGVLFCAIFTALSVTGG